MATMWLVVGLVGCGSGDSSAPAHGEALIGPSGGELALAGGLVVTIPPGALAEELRLTVDETAASLPDDLAAESAVYEFGPAGTRFAVPVRVRMPFTASGDDAGESSVYWTVDGSATEFEPLATTVAAGAAEALVSHFSKGLVAAKKCRSAADCREPYCAGDEVVMESCAYGRCRARRITNCSDQGVSCANGACESRGVTRCTSDEECLPNLFCVENTATSLGCLDGYCRTQFELDCSESGEMCENGVCTSEPSCESDDDCASTPHCVQETLVLEACRDNACQAVSETDCAAAGQRCEANLCTFSGASCDSDRECGLPYCQVGRAVELHCPEGRCVTKSSVNCAASDMLCLRGSCGTSCGGDGDCKAPYCEADTAVKEGCIDGVCLRYLETECDSVGQGCLAGQCTTLGGACSEDGDCYQAPHCFLGQLVEEGCVAGECRAVVETNCESMGLSCSDGACR